jgi:ABC-type polysaccharide/polyol phosphate transport system ATPase subunit
MPHISVRDVHVLFPVYQGSSRSLKKSLVATGSRGNLARTDNDRITVKALDGVSFDIEHGGRFGILGGNGAGKTTLLKVLAGIYEPTSGRCDISGNISTLLDAQSGLDPDATGLENIIMRGLYLNIHPNVMRKQVDEIAEFTELGHYLEMPVRTYSAGMMTRLGFAASTCIMPEILIMDEWLATGDAHFIDKAQRRMERFVERSSILILASHSMELLKRWCTRGLLLHQGKAKLIGDIADVIASYEEQVRNEDAASS